MTGIDNTVLAEALRLLSPYRDQGRVWDTLEELIAAPPAQREAILRQPRQQEPSTSESTKGRFFNGHNKKSPDLGSTNFAWWPEDDRRYPGQQFERMLTAQFLWYATHTLSPAQGTKETQQPGPRALRRMPGTWWKASAGSTASPARRCPPSTPKAAPGNGWAR